MQRRLRILPVLALAAAGACDLDFAPAQPGRPSAEAPALRLLAVSGGGTLYPAFAPDVHHYALPCADRAVLRVVAQAGSAASRLTLLRGDPGRNHVATHRLDLRLTVAADHDLAIEVRRGAARSTYVVHCLPADFPRIRILQKSAGVSEGLLFVTPKPFMAIVDNNGVPRFHRRGESTLWNFRPHATGPLIEGRRVRYSVNRKDGVELLDERLATIRTVNVAGDLDHADRHEFLITREGNFLFVAYQPATRDPCAEQPRPGGGEAAFIGLLDAGVGVGVGVQAARAAPQSCPGEYVDSVIQEVTPRGDEVFRWNSWDHFERSDCELSRDYAHLNSMQISADDIIASFWTCSQVLRIDRSGNTGAVEWQLGGAPPRTAGTEYLELVGDDGAGNEFCGQHQATLTGGGRLILFDNGIGCTGPRKNRRRFTRVVEYDVASGTQASYVRELRLPASQGAADHWGGVTVLGNGHWLISWGARRGLPAADPSAAITVTEYDPATDTALFHMHMSRDGSEVPTYRVYREPEAAVPIPLNLP